ncbi:acetyltransferase [Legionella bononiensis]|uniref:Acetyltransferase n=1 Tax=Legionella bononiensis TaxID=2793102 RepID=A0ABS1W7W2_9GAMM|nr:acetyltransferase [Legionella bononiensis]MBL7480039.1 acetyltransferase [Legionella bononiensis]MBL7525447.1 acetyltransferase [Legionella bononiensis]MBL7561630.1 acetyltransferase [Legionella bononiensis]
MHTKLKIIGCGGHSKVVIDTLSNTCHSYIVSLCDSNKELVGTEIYGIIVDSTMDTLLDHIGFVHVAIGNNQVRERIYNSLNSESLPLSIMHPTAVISKFAVIGSGSFVAANAILGPESSIGKGCIVNHGAIVDHEVKIGAYTHIAPNSTLGGRVRVGNGVLIGAGAVILPGISLGDGSVIGAGAVVVKDVPSGSIVKGVPAA